MNTPAITALLCAIQVLKGNDGDYSPHEKHEAIEQLEILLAEKQKGEGFMNDIPEATKEIFAKLLAHKVEFFEAGSIDGGRIFISGTIEGRAFALTITVDKPHELLK